jgi:hypothetical protein
VGHEGQPSHHVGFGSLKRTAQGTNCARHERRRARRTAQGTTNYAGHDEERRARRTAQGAGHGERRKAQGTANGARHRTRRTAHDTNGGRRRRWRAVRCPALCVVRRALRHSRAVRRSRALRRPCPAPFTVCVV